MRYDAVMPKKLSSQIMSNSKISICALFLAFFLLANSTSYALVSKSQLDTWAAEFESRVENRQFERLWLDMCPSSKAAFERWVTKAKGQPSVVASMSRLLNMQPSQVVQASSKQFFFGTLNDAFGDRAAGLKVWTAESVFGNPIVKWSTESNHGMAFTKEEDGRACLDVVSD